MFWSEEDIQPAVDMAIDLFGTVGNLSNEGHTIKNLVITSDKFGPIWYGDIEESMESVLLKCNTIAQRFNISVSPVNMS